MSDFDSAWWKWRWAVSHAEALTKEVDGWAEHRDRNPLVTTAHQYDAKRHAFVVRVATIELVPITWGLRLGDILSNHRQCLDHVAWAMVQRGDTPNLSESEAAKV